jgi:hypothetical protein
MTKWSEWKLKINWSNMIIDILIKFALFFFLFLLVAAAKIMAAKVGSSIHPASLPKQPACPVCAHCYDHKHLN